MQTNDSRFFASLEMTKQKAKWRNENNGNRNGSSRFLRFVAE
jgi:hypothetical protein